MTKTSTEAGQCSFCHFKITHMASLKSETFEGSKIRCDDTIYDEEHLPTDVSIHYNVKIEVLALVKLSL